MEKTIKHRAEQASEIAFNCLMRCTGSECRMNGLRCRNFAHYRNGYIAGATEQKNIEDAGLPSKVVNFECIGKQVTMSVQELIDYYVNQECVNVAEECGF